MAGSTDNWRRLLADVTKTCNAKPRMRNARANTPRSGASGVAVVAAAHAAAAKVSVISRGARTATNSAPPIAPNAINEAIRR